MCGEAQAAASEVLIKAGCNPQHGEAVKAGPSVNKPRWIFVWGSTKKAINPLTNPPWSSLVNALTCAFSLKLFYFFSVILRFNY